jgi:rRNA-processing protein FCF1
VLLSELMDFFASGSTSVVTTPHVMTEVSNLLGHSQEDWKPDVFQNLADVIVVHKEHYIPSQDIAIPKHFASFGLTDLGILAVALKEKCLVVTDDSPFANYLRQKQIDAFEFRRLREINQD